MRGVSAGTSPGAEQRSVVVVGVDGSLEATEAAQYAAHAATDQGLDLMVVHAFTPPHGVRTSGTRVGSAAAVDAAQRVVDDTLSQVRMPVGLHVRTEVEPVPPGELLLRLSRSAAVVVLGQHVFDIVDQLVEGSVASPLAATAHCPVAVVPRGWSRAAGQRRTVAVALEGHQTAEAVLEFAFAEAERRQSPIVALHADSHSGDVGTAEAEVGNLEEILAAAKQAHPDLAVSVTLVAGDVAQAVLETSPGVRLMVVGRGRHPPGSLLWHRSVAQAVLARAGCPLVVVP